MHWRYKGPFSLLWIQLGAVSDNGPLSVLLRLRMPPACHPMSTPNTLFLAWLLIEWSQESFPKASGLQSRSNSFPLLLRPVALCTLFQRNRRGLAVLTCHTHWIRDGYSTVRLLVISELRSFCHTVSLTVLSPTRSSLMLAQIIRLPILPVPVTNS